MKKINVIYWSGTGNTEAMANAIVKGATDAGAEVSLIEVSDATVENVKEVDYLAFGCPAMGAEELEDSVMRPFMDEANPLLKGKNVVLFGSYEWADGEWLRLWEDEINSTGAKLVDSLAVYGKPNDDAVVDCELLGKELAK